MRRSERAHAVLLILIALTATGCGDCGKAPRALAAASAATAVRPPGKRYLKGQLHAHSNGSADSDSDPEEVTAYYAAHGFDFLVLTDHDRITSTPSPPGLLVLPGVELTQNLRTCDPPPQGHDACLLHVNALFVAPSPEPIAWDPITSLRRVDLYGRALDKARALGGIAQLNHPNFHGAADLELVLALAQRGLTLMEIENRALDSDNEGHFDHPSTEVLWDAALSRGARIYGTASDDAHHYGDAAAVWSRGGIAYVGDRGFVMVRAEPTPASVREAIVAGDFYGSTGLLFDRLDLGREAIAVEVRDDGRGGAIKVELIGPTGVVAHASGLSLRFDPRTSSAAYLRVRAIDAGGRKAFSQPLWK
ncbi:MAG: CehA/McbA family metallohydrolase [Minicystis sp.]